MSEGLGGEFEQLRVAGRIMLDAAEAERHRDGASTLELYLARHGIAVGPWIEEIRPIEFAALHGGWCGQVATRADCIIALCERGLEHMPALSLRMGFDPEWYGRQAPGLADLAAAARYRHFLAEGSAQGLSPCEGVALARLWGSDVFPACFDWAGWAGQGLADGAALSSRTAALEQFLDAPGAERARFVAGTGSAHLLCLMAERAFRHHGRPAEARALFLEALERGGQDSWVHHLLGDLARDEGDSAGALGHYRAGIGGALPNRWSYLNAADLLIAEGDWRGALGVLAAGRGAWQETAPWRQRHDRAMHMWSQDCVARLVACGREPPPGDLLAEADALAAEVAARLPSPQALAQRGGGVLVITARPVSAARADHGLIAGVTVLDLGAVDRSEWLGAVLTHETVIFHEAPFTFGVLRAMLAARRLGRRVLAWLGDLADHDGVALARCLWGGRAEEYSWLRRGALRESALVARFADGVVTTLAGTTGVLDLIAPNIAREVLVAPAADLRGAPRGRRVVLVAPGGDLDEAQAEGMVRGLVQAAQARPDLHALVPAPLSAHSGLRDMAGRWSPIDGDPELPTLARLTADADLVLVPEKADTPFALSREAAARGVPAVTLPDEDLTAARVAETIAAALAADRAPAQPTPRAPLPAPAPVGSAARTAQRPRILLANVWAPPQQFGGAARIFTDNLDYYLDHHADQFDFALFASDEYNETCGQFTLDTWRGVPAFRVATPIEPDIYWRGDSAMMAARLNAVLDWWRPDLVHFHCLQRLTASLAQTCRERGVPYIVTMHDGWWLSDFVFVSDPQGNPALPARDWFDQHRGDGRDLTASALRARHLREALLGAERRLAESHEFAAIYEACGIPCEVMANGVSRIAPASRETGRERVELCHLGGFEPHKGAFLVEAALRRGGHANLHLTIVDLDQNSAFRVDTLWGSTPVTIIGRIPPHELSGFYARMNVLLAPSVWPESFGLVSREALAHGLWVIAGDRGAMGGPVTPGVNGFVVPVADASGLAEALAAIDRDPARYRASPPPQPLRTADDQARELIGIYRELTSGRANRAKAGWLRRGWTAIARKAMGRA